MPEMKNQLIGSVSIDNAKASREIATYLLERNHRDIVIMAGTEETYVNKERMKGVQKAFKEYGLEFHEENVLHANFSEEEAYALAKNYLQTKQPTAFLCFSDLMAFGVMRAVKEAGLRIPEDISITGFDNLVFSGYTEPKLTTFTRILSKLEESALLLQNLMEKRLIEACICCASVSGTGEC